MFVKRRLASRREPSACALPRLSASTSRNSSLECVSTYFLALKIFPCAGVIIPWEESATSAISARELAWRPVISMMVTMSFVWFLFARKRSKDESACVRRRVDVCRPTASRVSKLKKKYLHTCAHFSHLLLKTRVMNCHLKIILRGPNEIRTVGRSVGTPEARGVRRRHTRTA